MSEAKKSVCADCKREFSFDDEGGFLWEGFAFCENCDPEECPDNESELENV